MNACVVGHGMMGDWHARALRDTGCTLHTLVGRRPEPTRAFAVSHGFGRHTTYLADALATPEIDLVILANPSEQHAASAELVLAHGKHLLVEIPLAMSLTEAEALVAGADERALELGVVHPLRARVELVALRERLRRGD
jgi:2-hydroxy-4-carboxymuconate semialdehyde hemiacetal dehydrogenase